ncbi:Indoleamine 2,3-dioxygenase [Rickenella mellea]|uniref:Indoleamine 2,3-dioxygenase n=1 Tax=Rickenella mellea TaxID=50990 RepID=A0A4Y7QCV3_9AGAM|nr:Indoleamine 2,3-dioxygenase [Rickenella mellea]
MEFTRVLPAPSQLLHFALSAFNSSFALLKSAAPGRYHMLPNSSFCIDNETGFIPRMPPARLPSMFQFWERSLSEAATALSLGEDSSDEAEAKRHSSERWRQRIREGPVICTSTIEFDVGRLQRAHFVLAWLVHYYVHSTPPTVDSTPMVVPKSLAVPLVAVSRCLGIAPVLTYADTVLWNVTTADPELPLAHDNMRFPHLFSGTDDEHAFYVASATAELRGAEILRIIEDCNTLPDVSNLATISKISRSLTRVTSIIEELSDIMQSVRAGCDPHVFHWAIRPWYRGSDASGPDSAGWIYEGVENNKDLDLSGPSAGQSTLMHALDVWLDIDHKLSQKRAPPPSDSNRQADRGFMQRMRRYMPGVHQDYLRHLAQSPRPLRELARQTPALREPYNSAVMALKKLRDGHLKIACLYIITMSRSSRCPATAMMQKAQETLKATRNGPVRGTGGTEVSTLLKAGRDATRRAVLE